MGSNEDPTQPKKKENTKGASAQGLPLRSRGHGSWCQGLGRNPALPTPMKLPHLITEAPHSFRKEAEHFFHSDQVRQISALGKGTGWHSFILYTKV